MFYTTSLLNKDEKETKFDAVVTLQIVLTQQQLDNNTASITENITKQVITISFFLFKCS